MKNYANYYHHIMSLYKGLKKELPVSIGLINKLNAEAKKDSSLSAKQKALMALAIAINNQSDENLAITLHDAMIAGACRNELMETMELCSVIGGKSVLLFACKAYAAMMQLEEDSDEFRDSFYS